MEQEQEIRLTRGLQNAGKTTYAREWVAEDPDWRVRINRDDLRKQIADKYWGLSQHQEETVTLLQLSQAEAAIKARLSVIIDDTNLKSDVAKEWLRLGKRLGVPIHVVDIEFDLEECIRRDKLRDRQVGEAVIRGYYKKYFKKGRFPKLPTLKDVEIIGEPYIPDTSKPLAYICDIDSTLANMKPCGRSPFDWHRVGEDEQIENVVHTLRTLSENHTIIMMSGRDGVCRPETEEWLLNTGISYKHLYMRPEGSNISDDIVKISLFDKYVRDNYNVLGVFDDRLKVCRAWENIGLTLFRVGPIDADF